jgi:hypothetical protein
MTCREPLSVMVMGKGAASKSAWRDHENGTDEITGIARIEDQGRQSPKRKSWTWTSEENRT